MIWWFTEPANGPTRALRIAQLFGHLQLRSAGRSSVVVALSELAATWRFQPRQLRQDLALLGNGIEELLIGGTGDPLAAGLQQQGELAFFLLAEQQSLPALAAPDAAVPEEEPPGPLELIHRVARSHGGSFRGVRIAPVAG
jgi:hypothetical protein